MTVAGVARFYGDSGRHLVDEARYPSVILAYRRRENEIAAGVAPFYQVALEVGCMSGCLLYEALRDLPLTYVGIDVVDGAIAALRERIAAEQHVRALRHALTLDAVELERLQDVLVPERSVAMFPFNSFGNLPDPIAVLDAAARAKLDVWIGTYDTGPGMTAVRRQYYEAAAIGSVDERADDRGIVFTSAEGLHSYAYHEAWFRHQLVSRGYSVNVVREDAKFVFVHGKRGPAQDVKQ